MKKVTIILLVIGFSINIFSQNLTEKNIIGFYNLTFQDYFSNQKQTYKEINFYIQQDSLQIETQTKFDDFNLHFVNKQKELELIRKSKISELYWTKIKEISKDTIDVLIGGWSVEYKRKFLKRGIFNYSAWCGGTNGYVPQGRFIYCYKTEMWVYITENEIVDNKITEYQNKLKEYNK